MLTTIEVHRRISLTNITATVLIVFALAIATISCVTKTSAEIVPPPAPKNTPAPTPTSPTLEKIIERTQEAMRLVTSYQTNGTISTETNIINILSVVRKGTYSTTYGAILGRGFREGASRNRVSTSSR